MEIDMDNKHWEHGPCPKYDCRKNSCKCGLRLIPLPAALGDDSKGSPVAPKNGDYCNALVKYESNGHMYVYSTEGVPTLIYDGDSGGGGGGTSDFDTLTNRPKYNNTTMSSATNIPQVPTRTSDLTNDLDYQTATEVQSAISTATAGKQDTLTAGSNISISGNTISATDTTYTAGNGLDLTGTEFSVDTDVVATQSDVANVTSYITDATEYSASATYAVGDYAIYNGAIYQCNIAIVGGEAWNASHWDAVPSLQDQLDNTETWTFELEGGTTVTKKVVVR